MNTATPLTEKQKDAISDAVMLLHNAGFSNVRKKLRPAFKRTSGIDALTDWFEIYTVATITLDITPEKT